jgi:hypothetical protein
MLNNLGLFKNIFSTNSKEINFKQLENLIVELGSIVADEGTYLKKVYTKMSGSYTSISFRYNNKFYSVEYPNSEKDKRGLNNAYRNTRICLNRIGLSADDMKSLSDDYIGKKVSVYISLNQIWNCLELKRWGWLRGLYVNFKNRGAIHEEI